MGGKQERLRCLSGKLSVRGNVDDTKIPTSNSPVKARG